MGVDYRRPQAAGGASCANGYAAAEENFTQRFLDNESSPEEKPADVETAGLEGATLVALTYQSGDGQTNTIPCDSLTISEVGSLLKGLFQNIQRGNPQNPGGSFDGSGAESALDHRRQSSSSDSSSDPDSKCKRRRLEGDDQDLPTPLSSKKQRARGLPSLEAGSSSTATSPNGLGGESARTMQLLFIGNTEEVHEVYARSFKDLQQTLCKIIAKIWIKMINPNKQTHNPYAGGSGTAPWWWPVTPPEGVVPNSRNGFVRHIEPDHLKKEERLILLPHILGLFVDPTTCRPPHGVNISVEKLRKTTMDQMNEKFTPENSFRRIFLEEIFRVARAQERFKNGEIDGDYKLHVLSGYDGPSPRTPDDELEDGLRPETEDYSGGKYRQQPMFHPTAMSPVANSIHGDHLPHQSQQRPMKADPGHPASGHRRQLRVRQYSEQAVNAELCCPQNHDQSHILSQQPYPPRLPSNFPPQEPHSGLQEPYRRYSTMCDGLPGPAQYFPNAPPIANLMHHTQIQFHGFPVPMNVPIPHVSSDAPYLPQPAPMPLPAMGLSGHGMYGDDGVVDRVQEMHQSAAKAGIAEDRGQLRQPPQHPHGYMEFGDGSLGQDPRCN